MTWRNRHQMKIKFRGAYVPLSPTKNKNSENMKKRRMILMK